MVNWTLEWEPIPNAKCFTADNFAYIVLNYIDWACSWVWVTRTNVIRIAKQFCYLILQFKRQMIIAGPFVIDIEINELGCLWSKSWLGILLTLQRYTTIQVHKIRLKSLHIRLFVFVVYWYLIYLLSLSVRPCSASRKAAIFNVFLSKQNALFDRFIDSYLIEVLSRKLQLTYFWFGFAFPNGKRWFLLSLNFNFHFPNSIFFALSSSATENPNGNLLKVRTRIKDAVNFKKDRKRKESESKMKEITTSTKRERDFLRLLSDELVVVLSQEI